MNEADELIRQINEGERQASEDLLPVVYGELCRLAKYRIAKATGPADSIDSTGLVHEAFIRLVDRADKQEWDSKGHFFAGRCRSHAAHHGGTRAS